MAVVKDLSNVEIRTLEDYETALLSVRDWEFQPDEEDAAEIDRQNQLLYETAVAAGVEFPELPFE